MEEGQKLGLVVNVATRELITGEDAVVAKFKAIAPDIKHVNTCSIADAPGAPTGGEQSVDEVLSAKLQQLCCLSDRLSLLNVHDALCLLKNCFAIPKMAYTLQSATCYGFG